MRKRLVRIMCQATNRLITRMRAGKRLDKIKGRLRDEKVNSREDAMRMVREDWKTAQNIRLSEAENDDNIMNIKFSFYFNEITIQ